MIGSNGRITAGLTPNAAAANIIGFVEASLPTWRDDPERSAAQSEPQLNSQLATFLNSTARTGLPMFCFHHEELQGGHRSVDLSAHPVSAGVIVGKSYSKYDAILIVECKRLPTTPIDREREYVSSPSGKTGGGIQRFKLGVHGASHTWAAMVGYIQKDLGHDWFARINDWIDDLANSTDPIWTSNDRLHSFLRDVVTRTSKAQSEHTRQNANSGSIELTHMWVEM